MSSTPRSRRRRGTSTSPGQWGGLVSERIVAGSRFYATDFQGHARALLGASQAVTDTLLADAWGV